MKLLCIHDSCGSSKVFCTYPFRSYTCLGENKSAGDVYDRESEIRARCICLVVDATEYWPSEGSAISWKPLRGNPWKLFHGYATVQVLVARESHALQTTPNLCVSNVISVDTSFCESSRGSKISKSVCIVYSPYDYLPAHTVYLWLI